MQAGRPPAVSLLERQGSEQARFSTAEAVAVLEDEGQSTVVLGAVVLRAALSRSGVAERADIPLSGFERSLGFSAFTPTDESVSLSPAV